MNEFFKDVPGYEGYYKFSTKLRLFSIDRIVKSKTGKCYFKRGVEKASADDSKGYLHYGLYKNNIGKHIKIHKLIELVFPCVFIGQVGNCIDHIDGNPSNNSFDNLRKCSQSQNMCNSRKTTVKTTSKYKGLWWQKHRSKWYSQIRTGSKRINIGCFDDEIEAAKAYDRKAKELHGEFARLNFPEAKNGTI